MHLCKRLLKWFALGLLASSLVMGCASKRMQPSGGTQSLEELKKLRGSTSKKEDQKIFRRLGLKETALSLGARSGLAARAKEINQTLLANERQLDNIFRFSALIMENNVLPPVLVESQQSLNLDNAHTIRLADKTYRIVEQAKFVTTPPNWRDYLLMHYDAPERPHDSLLPKNEEEQMIWDEFISEGWNKGIEQANTIYADNLARLRRDYAGMVLYRRLLAQNMVSLPFVAKTELGITGGGSEMRVNDRVLRITALPSLQAESDHWQPIIVPGDNE